MFCQNCGSQIDDNAFVCPNCGVPTSNYTQNNNAQASAPINSQPQQPTYQQVQPVYQQVPTQQYYQQPYYSTPKPTNTTTLGILSIIMGFIIPLAGWIIGGIGLSKANNALKNYYNDPELLKGKKLCTIGLITTTIVWLLLTIVYTAIIMGAMY